MHYRVQELSWLTGIEWLSQDDAIRIYEQTDRLQSREHYGFAPELVRVSERVSAETDMTEWLRLQVPEHTSKVLIVFAREQVCRLSTATFIECWQDIFCPSRDDAIILAEDADWVLFYCHKDEFEFGHKLPQVADAQKYPREANKTLHPTAGNAPV
jgi:hypothetical protein